MQLNPNRQLEKFFRLTGFWGKSLQAKRKREFFSCLVFFFVVGVLEFVCVIKPLWEEGALSISMDASMERWRFLRAWFLFKCASPPASKRTNLLNFPCTCLRLGVLGTTWIFDGKDAAGSYCVSWNGINFEFPTVQSALFAVFPWE